MSAFAALLRRHRANKRLSLKRLAERADLSAALLSRMEYGERTEGGRSATRKSIAALADALGLSDAQRDEMYLAAGFVPPDIDIELLARLVAFIREARAPADAQRAA